MLPLLCLHLIMGGRRLIEEWDKDSRGREGEEGRDGHVDDVAPVVIVEIEDLPDPEVVAHAEPAEVPRARPLRVGRFSSAAIVDRHYPRRCRRVPELVHPLPRRQLVRPLPSQRHVRVHSHAQHVSSLRLHLLVLGHIEGEETLGPGRQDVLSYEAVGMLHACRQPLPRHLPVHLHPYRPNFVGPELPFDDDAVAGEGEGRVDDLPVPVGRYIRPRHNRVANHGVLRKDFVCGLLKLKLLDVQEVNLGGHLALLPSPQDELRARQVRGISRIVLAVRSPVQEEIVPMNIATDSVWHLRVDSRFRPGPTHGIQQPDITAFLQETTLPAEHQQLIVNPLRAVPSPRQGVRNRISNLRSGPRPLVDVENVDVTEVAGIILPV
mmetsp:Transcript_1771/g.5372  ORF Transcript_1771/g.5372 Transcript_1771/m.5372 type:complete len:379 (-) Transcript_1771:647-1783(-)